MALLAGDALSAYAGKYICDSDLPAEKKTAMIKELYDRTLGMIEGQTIDTDGKFDTLDGLLSMYEMKTSELLTFQIVDDILDVTSTVEELGKPIGSDAQQEKTTSVTLLGLDKARELAKKYTEGAEKALSAFENNEFLCRLTDLLLNRKN